MEKRAAWWLCVRKECKQGKRGKRGNLPAGRQEGKTRIAK
jgi:hypothetical protein